MAKSLTVAVVIFAVLWLVRDLYALESNHSPDHEDFHFDESSNNSSKSVSATKVFDNPPYGRGTRHSLWSTEEKVTKSADDEKAHKNSQFSLENVSLWDIKKFFQFFASLLYSANKDDDYSLGKATDDGNMDNKNPINMESKSSAVKSNKSKMNLTENKYREYKDTDETSDTIFRYTNESGFNYEDDEDDSYGYDDQEEYDDYEDDKSVKSVRNQNSQRIIDEDKPDYNNTNMTLYSVNQTISDEVNYTEEKDPTDNNDKQKFDLFKSENIIFGRDDSLEGEFIDEYINNPRQKVSEKEEHLSSTTSPLFDSSETETKTILLQDSNDSNVSDKEATFSNNTIILVPNEEKKNENMNLDQTQNNSDTLVSEKSIPKLVLYEDTKERNKNIIQSLPKTPPQNASMSDDRPFQPGQDGKINDRLNSLKVIQFQQNTNIQSPDQISPEQYNTYKEHETLNQESTSNAKGAVYNYERDTDNNNPKFRPLMQLIPLKHNSHYYNKQDKGIPELTKALHQQSGQSQLSVSHGNEHSVTQYDKNQEGYNPTPNLESRTSHITNHKEKLPVKLQTIMGMKSIDNVPSNLSKEKKKLNSNSNDRKQSPLLIKEMSQFPQLSPTKTPDFSAKQIYYDSTLANYAVSNKSETNPSFNEEQNLNPTPTDITKHSNHTEGFVPQDQFNLKTIRLQNHFNNTGKLMQRNRSGYLPFKNKSFKVKEVSRNQAKVLLQNKTNNTLLPSENPDSSPWRLSYLNKFNRTDWQPSQNDSNISRALSRNEFNSTDDLKSTLQNANIETVPTSNSSKKFTLPTPQQPITISEHPQTQSLIAVNKSEELQQEEDLKEYSASNENDNSSSVDEDSSSIDVSDEDNDSEYNEEYGDSLNFLDYSEKIINNSKKHSSQHSSFFAINNSKEPSTNSITENENTETLKPVETFDTILEYIYKYSNNPLFTDMREQRNVTM